MHYYKANLYFLNFAPELEELKYGGPFNGRKEIEVFIMG